MNYDNCPECGNPVNGFIYKIVPPWKWKINIIRKKWFKNLSNSERFLWPIAVGSLAVVVSYSILKNDHPDLYDSPYLSVFSVTFATVAKFLELYYVSTLKDEVKNAEKKALCKAAMQKIPILENTLKNASPDQSKLIYALADLAGYLNDICKCCDTPSKDKFITHRDTIGATRSHLLALPHDSSLTFNPANLIGDLRNITTTLMDVS